MKTANQSLSNQVKTLHSLLLGKDDLLQEKDIEIKNLQEKNQYLLEQFRLAQHKQFGKSTEANLDQGELFNEAEQLIDEAIASEKSQNKENTSKTLNQPKRKPLPKDLPRETVIIDLPDDEKSCDCCGNDLHQMGEKKKIGRAHV